MNSWAFATSPYGLGLSTERSWQLTPREFHALQRVYENTRKDTLQRWAIERAHFFNAHRMHPEGSDFKPWTPEDFLDSPEARRVKAQALKDQRDLAEAQSQHKIRMAQMKEGTFDESLLPAWARMTPEEKQVRGL